jgi:FkbM family methyltransferase
MPRTLLTDDARNLTFECLHAEEAEFLFEEVFTRRSYCQSGVHVPKRGAPLVVDVGANIGLFSLFALTENPRATVIAVEPAPQLFAILERNLNHHFDTGAAECVRALMLDEPGVQTLYYYADAPGESTRNPFERSMQRKRLATAMREGSRGGTESSAMGEEDVADGHPIAVEARTLSQVLDAASLSSALSASTIALLKIDVEGDEEQVLHGLSASRWRTVQQVVIEVHDVDGRLERVCTLLRRHGFRVEATQQRSSTVRGYLMIVPATLKLWYVFGVRRSPRGVAAQPVAVKVEVASRKRRR